ncbi:uncharacterized protein LOC106174910 [Lingula anatina]|uniref:Uncharacterized protein LOC106174910 n=1 Tax=Lingula anatina TaxID=7574 RepID=A0A1S3JP61_LINAN|nr:uncharacterized protein LOC106174910 [Lingula anatina]|eukprot:XP_013412137.1 uncharacterized protein LOC106174910 [Lingula anatina]
MLYLSILSHIGFPIYQKATAYNTSQLSPRNSPSLRPVYTGDCPFFKSTHIGVRGQFPGYVQFNLVHTDINTTRTFREAAHDASAAIQGRVVDHYVANVTAFAKGSCLSACGSDFMGCQGCSENKLELQVTPPLPNGSMYLALEGPTTALLIPQHYYVVELYCVLKGNSMNFVKDMYQWPDGYSNITLVSTCDFNHVRPGKEYIFLSSHLDLSNFKLGYAFEATEERQRVLRKLCDYQKTPVVNHSSTSNFRRCATTKRPGERNFSCDDLNKKSQGLTALPTLLNMTLAVISAIVVKRYF